MIDALTAFLGVVATGNFSKAARAQNIAVSSITRRVDWLESELRIKLFNRSSRGVLLTDAGERFLPRARNILAELAEARDAIAATESKPQGVLSITAPSPFGRRHVAPAIASFLKRHPGLEIDLHVSDDVVDLTAARFDLALRIGVLPDSGLLATQLAAQRRVTCASPAYLKQFGRPRQPEDLLQHNCLTVRTGPLRVGWWQFAGVNKNKPLSIRGNLRSDESEVLLQAAVSGVGIAHLATWLVSEDIAAGRLVVLFDGELRSPTNSAIHAVRVAGRSSAKAKLFIEHLRASFGVVRGELPYWDRPFEAAIQTKPSQ